MTEITMPPPRIGRVSLAVADLDRSTRFYEEVIGLSLFAREGEIANMGAGDETFLLLQALPDARPVQRATGLYHFAILVPSRRDLSRALHHLLQVDGPITGYADHAVSEAIYLTDPDGHGIEIYRDRPRSEWEYQGNNLRMTTNPIDLRGILGELGSAPESYSGMAAGTFVGHIHLQVAQIAATERFYSEFIGFDLMVRYGARATFLSANGYHHHLGGNTWAGENLSPAPDAAARLLWYEIVLPDAAALETVATRMTAAEQPYDRGHDGLWVIDPSGIRVLLTV